MKAFHADGVLLLPAAHREMLVMAKSRALFRARITNSIALLICGIGFGLVYRYAGLGALGPAAQMLTSVLLTICMFIGVQLTSDSIAREKREGTIGLLFLTHLTAFQIVLGKLIAHGLMGFFWLLIAVPLLSLLLIVGGLAGMQLAYLALAAINLLFFSCAVGLFVSARNTDRKKAAGYGTWIVMFFWWGIPILVQLANFYQAPGWVVKALGLVSLSGAYNSPFAGPRVFVVTLPWLNLVCIHILGWAFVGAASSSLRRRWQDAPAKAKFSLKEWWKNLSLGKPEVRLRLRRKLLDRNPFLWLACRERLRGLSVWIATVIILAFVGYVSFFAGAGFGPALSFGFGLCILHKAMMAAAASYQLQVEHEQGTLEMLTSTPLRVEEIVKGQILAVFRQFRGPVLLMMALHAVAAVLLLGDRPFRIQGLPGVLVLLGLGTNMAMYVFDLYAMAWAGMWGAVNVHDARNATGFAMLRIIIVPGLILGWIIAVGSLAQWYLRATWNIPFPAFVALWFLICAVNNAAWIFYIRRRLPGEIRTFALRRFSPEERKTFLGKVGRMLGRAWGAARGRRADRPPVIGSLPGKA